MANFRPLNNYALYILDKIISKYKLRPLFLDVACGNGYLSKHLAKKGWGGLAIDYSPKAINIAKEKLKSYKKVKVEKKSFSKTSGKYNTVLIFDFLEHVADDVAALKKVYSLLSEGGNLVIAGPSNPKEWRWDDDFYGHYRRYTEHELRKILIATGFKPITCYDYTFPVFWLLRRIYTKLRNEREALESMQKRTKKSSFVYAWDIPFVSYFLNNLTIVWYPIYFIQYALFKKVTSFGNAIIMLAQKK